MSGDQSDWASYSGLAGGSMVSLCRSEPSGFMLAMSPVPLKKVVKPTRPLSAPAASAVAGTPPRASVSPARAATTRRRPQILFAVVATSRLSAEALTLRLTSRVSSPACIGAAGRASSAVGLIL